MTEPWLDQALLEWIPKHIESGKINKKLLSLFTYEWMNKNRWNNYKLKRRVWDIKTCWFQIFKTSLLPFTDQHVIVFELTLIKSLTLTLNSNSGFPQTLRLEIQNIFLKIKMSFGRKQEKVQSYVKFNLMSVSRKITCDFCRRKTGGNID